jgi:hypothetical protein
MRELFDNIVISRKQDPHIAPEPKCTRKSRRYGRKATHPDKIVHLGSNEQNSQKKPSLPP